MTGVVNSATPTLPTSGAKASLGGLAGAVVEVTQGDSPPEAVVVHPVGKAGAVTASKACEKEGQRFVTSSAPISVRSVNLISLSKSTRTAERTRPLRNVPASRW